MSIICTDIVQIAFTEQCSNYMQRMRLLNNRIANLRALFTSLSTEAKESKDLNIVQLADHRRTTTRDRIKSEQANKEEFDTF